MDPIAKTRFSQAPSPITTPSNSFVGSPSDLYSFISFIVVIGIMAASIKLIKYHLNLGRRENNHRGLDESVIRKIPIFQFKKDSKFIECAVCLNEFKDDEELRMIPNCSHVFHIDCIDVWLRKNANCPLCRTIVSSHDGPFLPRDPSPIINGDEEFVVIEIGDADSSDRVLLEGQERLSSGELTTRLKARKFHKGTSMGDECIDIRDQDEQFAIVQPIRRSISMDSSADRQLYLAVQEPRD